MPATTIFDREDAARAVAARAVAAWAMGTRVRFAIARPVDGHEGRCDHGLLSGPRAEAMAAVCAGIDAAGSMPDDEGLTERGITIARAIVERNSDAIDRLAQALLDADGGLDEAQILAVIRPSQPPTI